MPINILNGLPAKEILESEKIFALEEDVARKQDIRPLRIAILNLTVSYTHLDVYKRQ